MLFNKKLIITTCLSAMVVFAATASMQTEPEKPQWKNLKVLSKNLTDKELDKIMDEWRDALGVKCGFCHARNEETKKMDFASDAKPEKLMARKMFTMTAKINKKYFKEDKDEKAAHDALMAAVTCYTCHNGSAQPETVAPAHPKGERKGPGAPAQNTPPTPPANTTTPPSK